MDRREVLRLLMTGAALRLAPHTLFALREARALLGTPAAPRTLSPHQYSTVTAIAELIIPRTETPGARDVGVGDFIDLMLTEWCSEQERTLFLNGLADVDARPRTLFGKDFDACSLGQQAQILRTLGEQMSEEADALRDHARLYRGSLPEPDQNFYYMIRRLALTAYYTTEAGATGELDFQIIPDRYDGCAEAKAGQRTGDSQ